jgi:hypothetical protein
MENRWSEQEFRVVSRRPEKKKGKPWLGSLKARAASKR